MFMSPSTMLSPLLSGATFSPMPGGGFSPSPTTPGYSPASPGVWHEMRCQGGCKFHSIISTNNYSDLQMLFEPYIDKVYCM